MSPSPRITRKVCDNSGAPPVRVGSTLATIASKTDGTPARTWTFSMVNPGAAETGLSISVAPCGMRAMRSRAAFSSSPVAA